MWKLAIAAVAGTTLLSSIEVANAEPVSVFNWTGLYVGANVGGAQNPNNGTSTFGPLFPPFAIVPPTVPVFTVIPGQLAELAGTGDSSGVIGGGQIGYNWQADDIVFGVEADVVGSGLEGSTASASRTFGPPVIPLTVTQTVAVDFGGIGWMASFRGRLGYADGPLLFYATGGAAIAGIDGVSRTTLTNGPGIGLPAGSFSSTGGSSSNSRWGWTVGGGIEWAFCDEWSVAGEYRHADFGTRGVTFDIPDGLGGVFATGTSSSGLTVDQVTARINYHFDGPIDL